MAIAIRTQRIRYGQHHIPLGHSVIEGLADMGHPLIDVHLTTRQTKATLTAESDVLLFETVLTEIAAIVRRCLERGGDAGAKDDLPIGAAYSVLFLHHRTAVSIPLTAS
jgi:hypothetical protein